MSYGGNYNRYRAPVSGVKAACGLGNCCLCVPQDEVAVWECLGEFKGIVQPGLHLLGFDVCGMCISTRSISTRVNQQITICETKTKDNVFVRVDCAVQCEPKKDKIKDAIYKLRSPVDQIDSYVGDVVRARIPQMNLDDVFINKDAIAEAVEDVLEAKMDDFGFTIIEALLINVEPDARVKQSMNAMETAKRTRIAQQTKAEADKYVLIQAAQAEAESKALQGQGIARQRAAICQGLQDSIGLGGGKDSADRVSELLLITQYFDTLEKMADNTGSKIFIPHSVAGLKAVATQIGEGVLGTGNGF
jgi:regulator of protease activity HflC (stomatin/prohibitin superfamily)